MFNDKYGLTQAVLEGTKTMTRRIIPDVKIIRYCNPSLFTLRKDPVAYYKDWRGMCRLIDKEDNTILPKYDMGEVLAIVQPYKDAIHPLDWVNRELYQSTVAWNNKMFVSSDLMPHKIVITDIKAELLQNISDEDCIAEGVIKWMDGYIVTGIMENRGKNNVCFNTPREAFACLIDRICGKGTWESNPFVFVYDFKLVRKKEEWRGIEL